MRMFCRHRAIHLFFLLEIKQERKNKHKECFPFHECAAPPLAEYNLFSLVSLKCALGILEGES